MTVSITIRHVPDETRDVLAARAAKSGRSLQEYLALQLRQLASRPDADDAISDIRARATAYRSVKSSEIIGDRDADRR